MSIFKIFRFNSVKQDPAAAKAEAIKKEVGYRQRLNDIAEKANEILIKHGLYLNHELPYGQQGLAAVVYDDNYDCALQVLIGGKINSEKIDDYVAALKEIKEATDCKIPVVEQTNSYGGITVGFYNRHDSFRNPLDKFLIDGHIPV